MFPPALHPQSREGQRVEAESEELGRLRAELAGALAEMETMKAVAEVSESTKAEAVAAVQRQCQEEVASLQAILKGEAGTSPRRPISPIRGVHNKKGVRGTDKLWGRLAGLLTPRVGLWAQRKGHPF